MAAACNIMPSALRQPEIVSKIEANGSEVLALAPDASHERFAREALFFGNVARQINFQPD